METDIYELVKNGIKDKTCIDSLISMLKCHLDESDFITLISALKDNLLCIKKDHEVFIGYLLASKWSEYNDETVKTFIDFVTQLVSSKTFMLKVCIRSLIKQFSVKNEVKDDELKKLHRMFDFIHCLVQSFVTIAPLASKLISDAIISFFPYIGKSLFILETYLVNTLQIISFVKEYRYQILANFVDKMLQIDVRIPRSQIEENLEDDNLQFDVDDMTEFKSSKSNIQIEKLDKLMFIMFTYIDSYCKVGGTLKMSNAKVLFKELLQIYIEVILKTQQSCHVQFILFYMASFDKRFSMEFINTCWGVFENPTNAQVIRQASSAFIASFLARANYLDKECITQQLKQMSEWLHRYLKYQDGDNIQADYRKHGAFYSACQSVFYIFIYHHNNYVDSPKGMAFIKSLDFPRIVLSKLNPFRFCLKSIVDVFARITRMYEIVFCYSIIDKNNRKKIISQEDEQEELAKHMENLFPFDPYMLPTSGQFIKPLYNKWKGNYLEDEDNEDNIELEQDMDEIDELFDSMENHLGLNEYSSSRKSTQSFDMMCVSPGFSLHNG